MKWLVTGAGGMLGHDLLKVLAHEDVTALTRSQLDIADPAAVSQAVAGHDIVINAAAWTDVDGAETAEEQATLINGVAVGYLAQACEANGAKLLQVSTDYVLNGHATSPYPEDAPTGPLNAYGRGKLVGETAALSIAGGYVIRTEWLYGEHGKNFVSTMLKLSAQREFLDVVDDQLGQPTWSLALAEQLVALGLSDAPPGVYHGTAAGEVTWHGLAQAVFSLAGLDPQRIRPVSSSAFPRPAPRPSYSVLGHGRWLAAGLAPQAPWEDQLKAALPALLSQAR
ncbi:dTDP-4-dehydrorhamnose reductase [Catelliglobosispora koreensis]|uniref:dTDP-4-dehydrorhamnose reductase n=1 Tax=Catelliglobosispora koreensis TaxID=129052 RepID=UPI000369012B|nr:dTDP-4-dehydrorhamnose reductase [Catelliglobosispora koreensis]